MKLGTGLTLYLSLAISVILSVYGYFHITARSEVLLQKTEVEVLSIGRTLRYSLEEVSALREKMSVQNLIDSVAKKNERTLGVIVYYPGDNLLFSSKSLDRGVEQFMKLLNRSMEANHSEEELGVYNEKPVFTYTFPLRDRTGRTTGWVAIVQHMSFVEEEIRKAKWAIFLSILALIAAMATIFLIILRKWISIPIAQLLSGVKQMAKGKLDIHLDEIGGSELSELAVAFNEMAFDLKNAQDRMARETETKMELERHLRQSEKLATIGQLASELAHEIGTPLNIIGGRAELAKRQLDDREATSKNLRIIFQQSEKITRTIQQFLGYARKKNQEQISVDIPALLESMLDLLSQQFEKQDISVVKHIDENLPAVKGDPDHLQQVFLNLMFNAVQAMPEAGTMDLTASTKWTSQDGRKEKQGLYVEVCVKDTGIGMDQKVLERIFEPFFTTKHQGTGLGLTVAKGIVKDHRGWLRIESEPGKGSIFRVYLPVFEEE